MKIRQLRNRSGRKPVRRWRKLKPRPVRPRSSVSRSRTRRGRGAKTMGKPSSESFRKVVTQPFITIYIYILYLILYIYIYILFIHIVNTLTSVTLFHSPIGPRGERAIGEGQSQVQGGRALGGDVVAISPWDFWCFHGDIHGDHGWLVVWLPSILNFPIYLEYPN